MATKTATPEDLQTNIDALTADVKALADSVARLTKTEAGKLKDRGQETYQNLAAEAGVQARKAGEMVQERPGTAMAVATGLGFVAGLLMGRK